MTGTAVFADDIQFSRPLYAQVVRSPHAHANILSIDLTAAKALPGVRSVITGDCYKRRAGLYLEDKNFIAVGKVRYRGEPVAAVAADSPELARRACELVSWAIRCRRSSVSRAILSPTGISMSAHIFQ